ncbi:MAG: LysE family translocator [Candidatus Dormibacteria bacterium]
MPARLLVFAGVSLLLAMTPGPDMATVTKNAISDGRRGAFLTIAGITMALVIHVNAYALGLSALLRAASGLYAVIKVAGAAYLVYLGVRALLATRPGTGDRGGAPLVLGAETGPTGRRALFLQGFLSALLNPKLAVFFVSFLPQFTERGRAVYPQLLVLGAIFAVVGLAWLLVYGTFVARLRDFFGSADVRRVMQRTSGVVLLGFGARLVLDRG